MLDALRDPQLFGSVLTGRSWVSWMCCAAAIFGITDDLTPAHKPFIQRCLGRTRVPTIPAVEAWLVIGRRGGKSRFAAFVAIFLACFKPGFPFCLPRMAPLYTREPPIPRNFLRRTIVQLRRPSPQPPLTCNRLEPPTFRAFLRHRSTLVAFLRQAGFVALAARQPAGTGSAQILRSMSPNSRRVRCPSANRSQ